MGMRSGEGDQGEWVVSWHGLLCASQTSARWRRRGRRYGGGMSSAKAQLESDTRTLAFEAGRKYRVR
eukprot:1699394-Pyramimonas_sp.AAC.1